MPNDFDALIVGQFDGDVQFIDSKSRLIIDETLKLSNTSTIWTLRAGGCTYSSEQFEPRLDLRGYWIYKPGTNMCWQWRKCGGEIGYWNENGDAGGPPHARELFAFEPVSRADKAVRIYRAWFVPFMTAMANGRPLGQPLHYVSADECGISCDELAGSTFVVRFGPGGGEFK
jgi:hypothetical protein